MDDGDARAERTEHMGQFVGNESAAENDEVLGKFIDAHNVVAGVEMGAVEALNVGDHGTPAGRDQHLGTFQDIVSHCHLFGSHETAPSLEHGDVGGSVGAVVLAAGGDGVNSVEHPVADVGPPDVGDFGIHT